MDVASRARQLAVLGMEFRGQPHPGQKYRHGWIPVGPIEAVLGKAMSQIDIEQLYGDALANDEFAPGAVAELATSGDVHIDVAGDVPDTWHVFADMTQLDAEGLAETFDWAVERASDVSSHGHRPADPVNGLLDWRDDSGWIVGYAPDGTVRFGSGRADAAASNDVRVMDLSLDEARALSSALYNLAATDLPDGEDGG
jgi:hypothetical protein